MQCLPLLRARSSEGYAIDAHASRMGKVDRNTGSRRGATTEHRAVNDVDSREIVYRRKIEIDMCDMRHVEGVSRKLFLFENERTSSNMINNRGYL